MSTPIKTRKKLYRIYRIERDEKRGNGRLDQLVVGGSALIFAYGTVDGNKLDDGTPLALLEKAAAEALAKIIGNCKATPHG